jgi:hypothetical protein
MEFQNLMTFEELCSCRNYIEASALAATRRQKLEEQDRNNATLDNA